MHLSFDHRMLSVLRGLCSRPGCACACAWMRKASYRMLSVLSSQIHWQPQGFAGVHDLPEILKA